MPGRMRSGASGEVEFRGIGVSPGVVTGQAYVLAARALRIAERAIAPDDVDGEVRRLEQALIETRRQIKALQRDLASRTALADAGILDAHLMLLDDSTFIQKVLDGVRSRRRNVEFVLYEEAERYAEVLAKVEDEYLRERVSDIRDVTRRVLRNLTGDPSAPPEGLQRGQIVVAADLAPSETVAMRKDMVAGFATDAGSPTSHTAMMARALEIPAVVALRDISERVTTGDELLIDGNKGVVIVRPTPRRLEEYGRVAEARRCIERSLVGLRNEPAVTRDGHRIVLSANIESAEETGAVIASGAEGVGLFRSEYLFLFKDRIVGEEEQAEDYVTVANRLAPAPVIIRTLDLGGDKFMVASHIVPESNPFLGCRSIRLSLSYPEHFKAQLRAILRASARGNVRIMYPMISNVGEILRANELLEEAKRDLRARGVPFAEGIEVGVMVETPAAALTADVLAQHVKFFSLGTNDLIQYTLAVDRVNERVAYLYEPTHPAVLKLIRQTVEAGHRRGIWVGLCGEMAADPLMTPLLVGMGIDEFSVTPKSVPLIKDAVRSLTYARTCELAADALECRTAAEVLGKCRRMVAETAPELLQLV